MTNRATGFFRLRDHRDLFEKLERDYVVLKSDASNSHAAFNFFVTAWHLLEWSYPDDRGKRDEIRQANMVLQICRSLANGAKHLECQRFNKVKETESSESGFWAKGFWADGFWAKGMWASNVTLDVHLTDDAAEAYGRQSISVDELADDVMQFWRNNLPQ